MSTCLSCGFENDEHSNFCLQCGADMADIQHRDTGDFHETKSASKVDIPKVDLQQTDRTVVPEQLSSPESLSRPEKTNIVHPRCDDHNSRGRFCPIDSFDALDVRSDFTWNVYLSFARDFLPQSILVGKPGCHLVKGSEKANLPGSLSAALLPVLFLRLLSLVLAHE